MKSVSYIKLSIILLTVFSLYQVQAMSKSQNLVDKVGSAHEVIALFPKTAKEIKEKAAQFIKQAKEDIDTIIAIPNDKRTFANTAKALDEVIGISNVAVYDQMMQVIELSHPDEDIRNAAHQACQDFTDFLSNYIDQNKQLYGALNAYWLGNAKQEQLNAEEKYFIERKIQEFKCKGIELEGEKAQQLSDLQKEINDLYAEFLPNISKETKKISVTENDLQGLDKDFVKENTKDGYCHLGTDYPTYFNVMDNCEVEKTRKVMLNAFCNRAYPANEVVLKKLIAKNNTLACLLGFKTFPHFDISNQMAKKPERVEKFIYNLLQKAKGKVNQELAMLTAPGKLPKSVKLTQEGKVKEWDIRFLYNHSKKSLGVDENEIAEYFPMQHTIDGLLAIYRQFFSIDFEEVSAKGAWHQDVKLLKVYNKNKSECLGYIFLDLLPRDNKYKHAAVWQIMSATQKGTKKIPGIAAMLVNFTKPTSTKESLFNRQDIETFFHEFGHALHTVLGRTQLASQSGMNVKGDFLELPSQMLEGWTWDRDILKNLSCHYKTQEKLPDTILDKMIVAKTCGAGYEMQRLCLRTLVSLNFFKNGVNKNLHEMLQKLYQQCMPQFAFNKDNHFYASFDHLGASTYASKYYVYLWSKVFALDVFAKIKKHGLLNPEIGQKYIKTIIGRGGSADPNELLKDFLGRAPSMDAFLQDMGLE